MKAVVFITISLLLLLTACSANTAAKPSPSLGAIATKDNSSDNAPTHTPEPEFPLAKVIELEDGEFVYAREGMNAESAVVGAAAYGVEFAVTGEYDGWCRVIYGDSVGFIEKRYLEIDSEKKPLPQHRIHYLIPEKTQGGVDAKRFNNGLKIENTLAAGGIKARQSINIYTSEGMLLAKDATLEISDGVITAPALFRPAASSSEPSVPVKIVIEGGKVTECEGITLEKAYGFEAASEMGKVVAADNTLIEYEGLFIPEAAVSVKRGMIYGEAGEVEIKPGQYLSPKKLRDSLVDVTLYTDDIEIDMLFVKSGNLLGERIYKDEVCLLQKGTLDKLIKANEIFMQDGYRIVIYDAYRPYSVTVKLYEKYRNKYVAPARYGSTHNKGAAVDMSLLDKNGVPIEMPSPIHTLNSSSNRNNKKMSAAAKANMDYMTKVMVSCGFKTIETEWWHFNDSDSGDYLRTDYDLNSVLRVIYE